MIDVEQELARRLRSHPLAEPPLSTDVTALIHRGRARRHRRIGATVTAVTAAGAAVTLTAVTLGPQLRRHQDALPGIPTVSSIGSSTASPTPTASIAPVPHAEIVRRCRPQLAKYNAYPMYRDGATDRWRVAHPFAYRPGDLVLLEDPSQRSNPELCLVPESGHEQDPVPFSALDPTRTARTVERCSEGLFLNGVDPGTTGPVQNHATQDLRSGAMQASAAEGDVRVAVIEAAGQHYRCVLWPLTWDVGGDRVTPIPPLAVGHVMLERQALGPAAKSIVAGNVAYWFGSGRVPAQVATIEFTWPGAVTRRVTVHDGAWALVRREPGGRPAFDSPYTYRLLDASGATLSEVHCPNPPAC